MDVHVRSWDTCVRLRVGKEIDSVLEREGHKCALLPADESGSWDLCMILYLIRLNDMVDWCSEGSVRGRLGCDASCVA